MPEIFFFLNVPAIVDCIWARPPPFYMRMRRSASGWKIIKRMCILNVRIIFATCSFNHRYSLLHALLGDALCSIIITPLDSRSINIHVQYIHYRLGDLPRNPELFSMEYSMLCTVILIMHKRCTCMGFTP